MKRVIEKAVCLALVALAAVAARAEESPGLTLERIFRSTDFVVDAPQGLRWLPDGERFLYRENVDGEQILFVESAAGGERRRILDWGELLAGHEDAFGPLNDHGLGDVNASGAQRYRAALSADGASLAAVVGGDLFLVDLGRGAWRQLTSTAAEELFPCFDPTGRWLAFVRSGDIYALDLRDGATRQLTNCRSTGRQCGIADWVYEEELGIERSFRWSPDGSLLSFVEYDTSPIGEFLIPRAQPLYADPERQRYPKAGTDNARIRLGVVRLAGGGTSWYDPLRGADGYLARTGWMPEGEALWFERLDRDQRRLELVRLSVSSGEERVLLTETDPAWVNVLGSPAFLADGRFVWLSERDGYRHAYLHRADGGRVRQLTSGAWEVRELAGLREEDGGAAELLLIANRSDPRDRELLAVDIETGSTRLLTRGAGTHEIALAPGGRYFIDRHSTIETPPRTSLHSSSGEELRTLADGSLPALADLGLSRVERFEARAADGTPLHGDLIRPPGFDPGHRYPLLLYVYGGPHSQLTANRWWGSRLLFFQYLARQGMIVAWLDNRGTAGRGRDFERAIYRHLGRVELEDQLAGVRALTKRPWIDPGRVAIYGGSYGGTMTLNALFRAPGVFRAGIAYAPVTDWRLYDTIYTERYMDRPQENAEGYDDAAPLAWADRLEGELLLFHGTRDNNVHTQNSYRLIDRLVAAGKHFRLMIYPGVRHGIRVSPAARLHFHQEKASFLREVLIDRGQE